MSKYSDLGLDPHQSIVTDESAIRNSIDTILGINRGELLFEPDFGSLDDLVFTLAIDKVSLLAVNKLVGPILKHDSRVDYDHTKSSITVEKDDKTMKIDLRLIIKESGLEMNYKRRVRVR